MTRPRTRRQLHPAIAYVAQRQDDRAWSNDELARFIHMDSSRWSQVRAGYREVTVRELRVIAIRFPNAPQPTLGPQLITAPESSTTGTTNTGTGG
jgi:hypothetical protein